MKSMSKTIPRPKHLAEVRPALKRAPIVALLGARQCGKTTLAREVAEITALPFAQLAQCLPRL